MVWWPLFYVDVKPEAYVIMVMAVHFLFVLPYVKVIWVGVLARRVVMLVEWV